MTIAEAAPKFLDQAIFCLSQSNSLEYWHATPHLSDLSVTFKLRQFSIVQIEFTFQLKGKGFMKKTLEDSILKWKLKGSHAPYMN